MAYAVPQVAGVPPLLGGFIPVPIPAVITSDAISLISSALGPAWGIFLNGVSIVDSDNVISMDARQEWVIADFPIEGGGFESYDKVLRPFDVRFRFSTGGSVAARSAMIQSIKAIAGDYNLYMFVAPDDVWENVNVSHFDYHRAAAQGNGLFSVDVWGWQIQLNTGGGLGNPSDPASANPSVSSAQPGTPSAGATSGAIAASEMTTGANPGFAVGGA
jgi:hypothetical protein